MNEKERYQQKILREETIPSVYVKRLIVRAQNRHRDKGYGFFLEYEDVFNLLEKQEWVCALSGVKMTMKTGDVNRASIDRIDSDLGYISSNIQMVTSAANKAKMDLNNEEFILMACRIADANRHKVAHLL
jgi:hypothetical protein